MATPGERWRGSNLGNRFGRKGGDRQGAGKGWRGGDSRGNKGNKMDRWNKSDRGGRGGNIQQNRSRFYRFIKQKEYYQYGNNCAYFHNISNRNK